MKPLDNKLTYIVLVNTLNAVVLHFFSCVFCIVAFADRAATAELLSHWTSCLKGL